MSTAVLASCNESSAPGGGSGSGPNFRFCKDYNDAFCARTFECTPAAERSDPLFMGLFGKSASECAQRWAAVCEKPTGQLDPSVSCTAGKTVNTAKAAQCIAKVKSVSCAQIEDSQSTQECEQVCSAGGGGATDGGTRSDGPPTSDAGGPRDGGSTADAKGPLTPTAEKAAFCQKLYPVLCKRTFECIPPARRNTAFTEHYGNTVDECIARLGADCASWGDGCEFIAGYGTMCLQEFPTEPCDIWESAGLPPLTFPPASCLAACWAEPPP